MKALILTAYNRFQIKGVPVPGIGPDDVLTEVTEAGICGSDVYGMDGRAGRRIRPLIMGLEAAGVTAEVDRNVTQRHWVDRGADPALEPVGNYRDGQAGCAVPAKGQSACAGGECLRCCETALANRCDSRADAVRVLRLVR